MSTNKSRDAEGTKALVLSTAETIFSESGYAGTSLRMIAEASGSSVPLIIFHFATKDGLYEAVKANIVRRYTDAHGLPCVDGMLFGDFLASMVRSMFEFYRDNPTLVRLANWTHLEGRRDLWPGKGEWCRAFMECIVVAQDRGEIRADLSPLNISGIICGAVHIWWEYHDHFMEHAAVSPPSLDEQYLEQLLSFVSRALSRE